MSPLPHALQNYLEDQLKRKLSHADEATGGSINSAAVLSFTDGSKLFLKWNQRAPKGIFQFEREGLEELSKPGVISTPAVVLVGDGAGECSVPFLLMEYLAPGAKSSAFEVQLGRSLARLHRYKGGSFGFRRDNLIGTLPQNNQAASTWGEFFFQRRLLAQAELGERNGWVNERLMRDLIDAETRIVDRLNGPNESPVLLHGDLWGGNVFWAESGPVLIDPAVYYGSREADLAFTEFFGGFGRDFYRSYHETFPLQPGYSERKRILNLYHCMTHANMFGGSYVSSATRTLSAL